MSDLKNMEPWEAVNAAIEASGLPRSDIAALSGISLRNINRYCSRGDNYAPSLEAVVRLCRACGNTILIQWVEAQLELPCREVEAPTSRAQVMTVIARAVASLGEANRLVAETEDGGITPFSARQIRSVLFDVRAECRTAMLMLQFLARHRDITTCAPLASLGPMRENGPAFYPERKRGFLYFAGRKINELRSVFLRLR